MASRRTFRVGLCVVCGLVLAGVMVPSASATTSGVTVFTCKKNHIINQFSDNHCSNSGSPHEYGHAPVAENTTTETTGTAPAETKIKATIAGIVFEIRATGANSAGSITNTIDGNGDHLAHGEGTITYTGATVAAPAGKGCKVFTDSGAGEGEEGVIHTEMLKTTTAGQGDAMKFEPKEGTTVARFQVTGCTGFTEALNGTYTLTGTFKATSTGATANFNHASITTENTLKLKGAKAGIEGSLTYVGKDPPDLLYTPLALTTVS